MKDLVNYIQIANGGIIVTFFKAKFIESMSNSKDLRPHLVFIGVEKSGLFFDTKETLLQDVYVVGYNFST